MNYLGKAKEMQQDKESLEYRQKLVKSIIDPLFKKFDPSKNEKTELNLPSVNGICFEAYQRYTDDRYFVDVTFAKHITIKELFFDGRKLEIGGFGSDGKPLLLGLVELLHKHIDELTKDYDLDLTNRHKPS